MFFILILLFVTACGNKADYEGQILEVKQASIVVGEDDVDPEATYPAFEISVNESTEINGKAASFSELQEHQKIKVWIAEEELNVNDSQTAREITIEE